MPSGVAADCACFNPEAAIFAAPTETALTVVPNEVKADPRLLPQPFFPLIVQNYSTMLAKMGLHASTAMT